MGRLAGRLAEVVSVAVCHLIGIGNDTSLVSVSESSTLVSISVSHLINHDRSRCRYQASEAVSVAHRHRYLIDFSRDHVCHLSGDTAFPNPSIRLFDVTPQTF